MTIATLAALRRAFFGVGIRARLILVVASVLAVVAIGLSLYLPARTRTYRVAGLAREASTVGRIAARSVTPALLFDDRPDAAQIVEDLRRTAGVSRVEILDASGSVFATAGSLQPVRRGGRDVGDIANLHATTPIVHGGQRLGTVHVAVSLAELETEVDRMRKGIWLVSGLLFLVATLVTVALGRAVIRPLSLMAQIAARIARGEPEERVPITSDDEVATLGRALNEMLDRLLAARRDLEILNQGLEQRVEERTRQLAIEGNERARAADALRCANETFVLAASAVQGAIYDWNILADEVHWSDGLARVFGYQPGLSETTEAWWLSHVHPADIENVRATLAADLAAGRDFLCEYRFRAGDGSYLTVLDRGRVLIGEDRTAVRLVGVMENITPLRQLEEQFLHSQRMEAVGQLAGGIAHDFNNLLTTILGYGELLASTLQVGDPRRRQVEEIRRAGERAAGLTQQLLAFSRKQATTPRVIGVRAALGDLENMLRRLIGEDIHFRTELPLHEFHVRADPAQLDQAIVNVVVNARDSMPGGGDLLITAAAVELDDLFVGGHLGAVPGPYVMIEIRDTGAGMTSEVLGRIYEPFFTTKEVGKGTGLGMSIVYGVVTQSGGQVTIDSVVGKGTTVRIYLPLVAPGTEPGLDLPTPAGRGGTECLLVVEDEEGVRAMLREFLSQHGYTVLTARNGEEALRVCARSPTLVDLVLTDLVMPVMSGREMSERMRKERPSLRVVYMSGYPEDRIRAHSDLAAGSNYLQKPFTLLELLLKVREILDAPAPAAIEAKLQPHCQSEV